VCEGQEKTDAGWIGDWGEWFNAFEVRERGTLAGIPDLVRNITQASKGGGANLHLVGGGGEYALFPGDRKGLERIPAYNGGWVC